ncbi:MAG: hypothetical protein ACHQIO_16925, partial [Nevskiales bacterium]
IMAADRVDRTAIMGLSLAAIAMIGDHQPTALIFALYAAIYVVARLAALGWRRPVIASLGAAAAIAGLGSVFFLAPFALERAYTAEDFAAGNLVQFVLPSATQLAYAIRWGSMGHGPVYSTYFGYTILASAAGGGLTLCAADMRRLPAARLWLLLAGLAVLSVFVVGAYVREVVFTFFFLCAAAAVGAQLLVQRFPGRTGLPALLWVAFLIDAGPSAVQPWTRSDLHLVEHAGQVLAVRAADARVLEVNANAEGLLVVSVGPDSTPLQYGRVQELRGPHKLDATKAHNAFAATLQCVQDDLRATGMLGAQTRAMLALENIGWVVGVAGPKLGLPQGLRDAIPDSDIGSYWRIADATPFVTSGRLDVVQRPASFDGAPYWNIAFDLHNPEPEDAKQRVRDFYQRMQVDLVRRQAGAILVTRRPDDGNWVTGDGTAPQARPLSYAVTPGSVHLVVDADRVGFIRLAHPLSAFTRVTRNGVAVTPIADVESLIVLPVLQGTNDIMVTAAPSPLRVVSFWITVVAIAGLIIGLLAALAGRFGRSGERVSART